MKKIVFFVLFFAFTWSVSAQELIMLGGAGLQKTDSTSKTNYGFVQARLMINMAGNFRIGPYLGYTQYGSKELYKTPNPALLGKEWSTGLSIDQYGHITYSRSYYYWINTGVKFVRDHFRDNLFDSRTKTNEFFISGGFFVTDDWQDWFGNNRIMAEYQKPFASAVLATWKGEELTNIKPYNKESIRIFGESGIKRIGKPDGVNIEPLIHLGYGRDFGRDRNYYELGGGISLGLFRDYYRDILKVKCFMREDFNGSYLNVNSLTPNSLCWEFVFNASALVKVIRKK
ncbi:MAG: hypothetical protein WAW11_02970 [Patescibacteria group bacterium]